MRRLFAPLVALMLFAAPVAAYASDVTDPDIPLAAFVPDSSGIPTVSWSAIGFDKASVAKFPVTSCPVAVGLLRMWVHASAVQRASAEYRSTFAAVNAELLKSDCVLFPNAR